MRRTNKKPGRTLDTTSHESEDIRTLLKGSSMFGQDKFNNVSVAIFICDLKGSIIEVNKAVITLTKLYLYTS